MKRIECFLAAASLVAAVANASAMIPEQVRIETGLLAGVVEHWSAERARLQRHPLRGAAARREPVAGAAAGCEVGGRAQG